MDRPDLWAPFSEAPRSAGIVTDFDGTLSAIVVDPAAARPLPGALDVLADLARRFKLVAVVSGRPVSFLLDHAHAAGVLLYGLYGLEWCSDGARIEHDDAAKWRAVVETAARDADAAAPDGVVVERKGLSMTVHVRATPEHETWARSWADRVGSETGLAVHDARMSFELRPPIAVDKGTVVTDLAAGLDAVCFAGDDRGDLTAFDALDRLAADGKSVLKVAVASDEAPAELLERADVILDGPSAVLELFRELARG